MLLDSAQNIWPVDTDAPPGAAPEPPPGCSSRVPVRARIAGEEDAAITEVSVLLAPQEAPAVVSLADAEGQLAVDPPVVAAGADVTLTFRLVLPDDVVGGGRFLDTGLPGDTDAPPVDLGLYHLRWFVPDGVLLGGGYGGLAYVDGVLAATNTWRVPAGLSGAQEVIAVLSLPRPGGWDLTWRTATVEVRP